MADFRTMLLFNLLAMMMVRLIDAALYRKINVGYCTSVSQAKCKEIEQEGNYAEFVIKSNSLSRNQYFPPGCYLDTDDNRIYYNKHTSKTKCMSSRICLCQRAKYCPKENGRCVAPNGDSVSKKLESGVDLETLKTLNTEQQESLCIGLCSAYPGATGCEILESGPDAGCYVHNGTVKGARGNNERNGTCWILSKCRGPECDTTERQALGCEQYCELSKSGVKECKCNKRFKLREDKKTCRIRNGREMCEKLDYSKEQCQAVGCCVWDFEECVSAVGTGSCIGNGRQMCEKVDYSISKEQCQAVGCCHWDDTASVNVSVKCVSAVGTRSCIVDPCKACDQVCNKVGEDHECSCNKGYKLLEDKKTCEKLHPCDRTDYGGCEQKCTKVDESNKTEENKTGKEHECSCNKGFKILGDGKTCQKLDPCEACDQVCNKMGKEHECSCNKGFKILEDGKTCEKLTTAATTATKSTKATVVVALLLVLFI